MATPNTAMTLIAALIWACLSGTSSTYKHVLYATVLPTLLAVQTVLSTITLILAPGLFDVVQFSTPPTIAYLSHFLRAVRTNGVYMSWCLRRRDAGRRYISAQVLDLEMAKSVV